MLLCFISIQHKPNQPQQPCDKLSLWPKGLQPGADVPKLISKLKLKCSFRQIGFAAVWRVGDVALWFRQDLDHQRTCLEEDSSCLRAEIQELKTDIKTPHISDPSRSTHAWPGCESHAYIPLPRSLAHSLTRSLSIFSLTPKSWDGPSFIFQNSFSALELRIFNSGFTLTGGLWAWGINGAGLWSSTPAWDSFPALPHWCDSVGSTWPRGSSGPLRPQSTRPSSLLLSILNTSNTSF